MTIIGAQNHHRKTCDCLAKVDKKLAEAGLNTKVETTMQFAPGRIIVRPKIETSLIEKKRGARPVLVAPTYCPFCGKKYPEDS